MAISPTKALPAAWYPLCRSDDLKAGAVLPVQINGVRYALWRSASGKVGALAAICCHVGADLARGRVIGESLQCPLHHWCYGVDGACLHIPANAVIPPRARQSALTCVEIYGLVMGFAGGIPSYDLPHFAGEIEPVWSRATVVDVAAPYTTLVANSYDGQHFEAVHDRQLLEPPQITRANLHHIAIHYRARVVGQRLNDRILRGLGIDRVEVTIHCWGGSVMHVYNQRTANTILVALLPLDEQHSRVFIVTALKEKAHGPAKLWQAWQLVIARWLAVAFLRPDMAVLEGVTMHPRVLLPGTDDCLVTWLRYWRALPRPEQTHADEYGDVTGQSTRGQSTPGQSTRKQSAQAILPEALSGEYSAIDA